MTTDYHSSERLRQYLEQATAEECMELKKVLDGPLPAFAEAHAFFGTLQTKSLSPSKLQESICSACGHSFGNMIRGEGVAYVELLEDACEYWGVQKVPKFYEEVDGASIQNHDWKVKKLKVGRARSDAIIDARIVQLETLLLNKVALNLVDSMDPEKREQVGKQIAEQAAKIGDSSYSGLTGSAAAMAAAKAGGFGTYMLMSSTLSTLSMGTLSFGAYTFASSALRILLGPAGLVAMGAMGLIKLGSPSKKKVANLGLCCAMIAMRLRAQDILEEAA